MKLRVLVILATLPAVSITLAGGVSGQTYETPPVVSARAVLGADASGSTYQIEDAAPSDGFLRFYTITTRYGRFEVHGRDMLKVRLQELSALTALERMDQSEVFLNAAAKAGLAH